MWREVRRGPAPIPAWTGLARPALACGCPGVVPTGSAQPGLALPGPRPSGMGECRVRMGAARMALKAAGAGVGDGWGPWLRTICFGADGAILRGSPALFIFGFVGSFIPL